MRAQTVLLGQIDSELVQHLPGVSLEGAKEGAVSVHHNETKLIVVGEQRRQRLRVELNTINELVKCSFHKQQVVDTFHDSIRFVLLCLLFGDSLCYHTSTGKY
jgi:hypothetical protein